MQMHCKIHNDGYLEVMSKKSWAPGESELIPSILSISSTEGEEDKGFAEGLACEG